MPIPFAAIALGMAVVGAGQQFKAGQKADKDAKDVAAHDAALIRQQAEFQVEAIMEGKEEAETTTKERMSDMSKKALIERGRILAAAGEAGVAGASVAEQLLMTYQDEATAKGRELYNLSATKRQLSRDIGAVQVGLQVNLPRAQKLSPGAGSAIFSAGIAGLQAYVGAGGKLPGVEPQIIT